MDGNGRWAKERHMPRLEGHRRGAEVVRMLIDKAPAYGLSHITFYVFSSENWNRPEEEVNGLMDLLRRVFTSELPKLKSKNIKIKTLGDKSTSTKLPEDVVNLLTRMENETADNTGLHINFAINYGGRDEILRACQCFVDDVEAGRRWVGDLDERLFSQYLDTDLQPDPDLIVRTGGDMRVSNFMLWQIAYAELCFLEKYWPDFTEEDLKELLNEYTGVERRFGGLPNLSSIS